EPVTDQVLSLGRGMVATGTVVDSDSQGPIPEAQVSFVMQVSGPNNNVVRSGKTGPDGRFEVKGLAEGTFSLGAGAKGYFAGKAQTVDLTRDGETEFTLTLSQASSISGRVVDSSGTPVAGASVRPNISFSGGGWDPRMGTLGNLSART